MSTSAAQKLARQRYKEKSIELVAFEVKKGMSKEYSAAAAKLGLGKMEMIRRSIAEFIQNHAGADPSSSIVPADNTAEKNPLSAEQKKFVDEFSKLPVDAQKSLLKFLHAVNENNQP